MRKYNYLALMFGAVLAAGAAYSAWSTLAYIGSTQATEGVVVATPIGPHHPYVVFTDANGNQIRFSANGDISQEVGDRVTVRYSQEDPRRSATIDTFRSRWTDPFMLALVAMGFIVAGVRNIPFRGWGPEQ